VQPVRKICSGCSASFDCGANDLGRCWCNAFPPFEPDPQFGDCLCPKCLEFHTKRRAVKAVSTPLIAGEDYYFEGAAMVFTAAYHLKRGYCCGNGCRHCPYG